MKRITLIFSIFSFAFFSLNAQQSDEKALKILDKVSQNMKTYKTIYAEFGFELKTAKKMLMINGAVKFG